VSSGRDGLPGRPDVEVLTVAHVQRLVRFDTEMPTGIEVLVRRRLTAEVWPEVADPAGEGAFLRGYLLSQG
jgi:hypothetical protein